MKQSNKTPDQSLEQLYEQRKAGNPAPLSIKRQLLAKHHAPSTLMTNFRRLGFVATAACTLVLIGLLAIPHIDNSALMSNSNLVYIHTLEDNTGQLTSPRSIIKEKYTHAYKAYIQQRQTFALHHQKQAKLELANGNWQLKTCDDKTILLSKELIAALTDIHKIDYSLTSGDIVNIAFAQNGIVLSIDASAKPMQCS